MKGCHPTDTRTLSFIRHPSTIMKIRGTSVHPFMISVGMDGGVYLCNVARVRSKSVKPHRVLVFQLKVNPVNEEGILIEDTIVSEPVSFSASTKLEDNCIKNIPMSLALFAADWNHQSPDQSHWFAAGGASGLVILSAAPTK
ncbi:hypothetical protein HMI54_012091 [Coelomomyces lativittatus]|nr:hypothetical protein HMI54_012091 [Coelomomyces lativittatus]KAJ1499476.1 hypothetical protein HMI55_004377 [Coelomomyces lativittatus]KAJ1513119.1 hypothetical protein HMI56_003010 [Coelomomyces lativittatus]